VAQDGNEQKDATGSSEAEKSGRIGRVLVRREGL